MAITIQQIDTKDARYALEQELRNKILLRPIGVPDHAWEMHDEISWHFIALQDEEVIGCVVLRPLNEEKSKAQLMQMAVDTNRQGQGIGRKLVDTLLQFCSSNAITEVVCHARENAIQFYANQGFEIYDEPFEEVGIMHRHMRKTII